MPTLVIGREIVAEVLRSGDISPYLAAGLTLDFMSDNMHPAYAAVFTGQDIDAWLEILRHQERFGKPPELGHFRKSFPEVTYDLPSSRATPAELVGLAVDAINLYEAQMGSQEAGQYIDVQDPVAAAEIMAAAAEKILSNQAGVDLPFRLLSLADIELLPDPEILIDGLIDHGTVTKLVGESGKGKSFVAIDWSLCIATGRRWQGRQVRKGRVLYIAAEGGLGLKKRIRAWTKTHGDVPAGSFELIPDAVQLANAGHLQALVRVARDFDVVVIDTLARTSAGLEENSAKDMGLYMNNCYKIRDAAREAGATVIVVHHTGYDTKRARGSSALFANGDGEILIESGDPHESMTMTVKKRKDGEAGQQLYMHLDTVDCGEWTSCVVEAVDADEAVAWGTKPRRTRADDILDALSDTEWRTQAAIREATGLGKSVVSDGCSDLVQRGQAEKRSAERSGSSEYRRMSG